MLVNTKIFVPLVFLAFSLSALGQQQKRAIPFKNVKTIVIDINNDGRVDTIIMTSSLKEKNFFNKITVSLSGLKKKTFYAKEAWTEVDQSFLESNKNTVNSKLLFLKSTNLHAVILLFGVMDGAGYRGEFSILNIENGNVKMVFDHADDNIDVEVPRRLTDLEQNGRLCFIYNALHEFDGYDAKSNSDIGSYAPYFVYPVSDTCKLDKPLTKKYNQHNYVFAGFNYDEKIRILYPRKKGKFKIYKK